MNHNTIRELEWMLGGDITKLPKQEIEETVESESITESLSIFISTFENIEMSSELNESIEELNLMEDFIKIQEAIESIKDKVKLDESELAAMLLVPVLSSLGVAGIGLAVKSWTDGNAFIPVFVWKALDKISKWINGDPKKANQFKSLVSSTKGITPLQAAKFTNIVSDRKEMMKRFPRMAER